MTKLQAKLVDDLVELYVANRDEVALALEQLRGQILADKELGKYIHSIKWRIKDPEHVRDSLERKIKYAKDKQLRFEITRDNFFTEFYDLAGIRILHLHTQQMEFIDKALKNRLDEARYQLIGEPTARTWDDETEAYFEKIGIKTKKSETLYTSVHYVLQTFSKSKYTCEIQVRTLAEELWGETSHTINYPEETSSVSCKEQLAVLARVTSAATRLVDAIFRSHREHLDNTKRDIKTARKPATPKATAPKRRAN